MKVYAVIYTVADKDTECHTQQILGIFTTKKQAEIAQTAVDCDGERHSRISELDLNVAKAYSESDEKRLRLAGVKARHKHEYACDAFNDEFEYRVEIMQLSVYPNPDDYTDSK